MNLDQIEEIYQNIVQNTDKHTVDEINVLVKELERKFLLPLMEGISLVKLRDTREWKLYVEVFNLKKFYHK